MLLVSLLLSGCYKAIPIRPTQLPRVHDELERQTKGKQDPEFKMDVERPDGTTYHLEGEFDLRITQRNGRVFKFSFPISATVSGDTLTVSGRDQPAREFSLASVTRTDVVQPNGIVWALGIGAGSVVVLFAVLAAAI